MKSKKTLNNKTGTLVVLGAGASIGSSLVDTRERNDIFANKMPSGINFFYDVFAKHDNNGNFTLGLNYLDFFHEGLNRLIVDTWGLKHNKYHFNLNEWKNINIEDVFTYLDIGTQMYHKGTKYNKGFESCRDGLKEFISLYLTIKSDGYYCEYLSRILKELNPDDSIISFNWDTIADYTIQYAKSPIFNQYINLMKEEKIRIYKYRVLPILLKLHGSLNWYVCPNPNCSNSDKPRLCINKYELENILNPQKCPICGNERCEQYIIPPTSRKVIRPNSFLHKLWLIARYKLCLCRQIIFIGYSFPSTDFYSEWLFRQIYYVVGGLPDIIIVNPEITKKNSLVSRRYETIFHGCNFYKYSTLKNFIEDGLFHLLNT
jgi:NAD-dependent SIR2 family protein deacetylase